jgi:hypothetical protein
MKRLRFGGEFLISLVNHKKTISPVLRTYQVGKLPKLRFLIFEQVVTKEADKRHGKVDGAERTGVWP